MLGLNWTQLCRGDLWHNPFPDGFPNVSICFQHTILIWIPVCFFWILLPCLLMQAKFIGRRYISLPWSPHLILKLGICSFITLASLFTMLYTLFSRESYPPSDILYPILWTGTFLGVTYAHFLRKQSGMVTSGILHLSAVLFAICGVPQFYQNLRQWHDNPSSLSFPLCITYIIWYSSVLIYSVLMCFADPRDPTQKANVELDSSFFNRLILWWFNPIPWKGAHKDLEPEDLFELNEGSTTKYLSDLWEMHWEPRLAEYHLEVKLRKSSAGSDEPSAPSIVSCLFVMFRWEFLTAALLKATSDTLQFANPFLLHQLIGFVSDPKAPLWIGLSYTILMFAASEVRSFVLNSYFYIMFRMGIKFQTALTAAVYKKTLKLSNSARKDKTVGEIVNLMAIDVERFQMITPQIQQFWSCPLQIIMALAYLFFTLGYSAAPGVVIMIIFIPSNILSSIIVKKWQVEQMRLKDDRTKMVNELLNGIKILRLISLSGTKYVGDLSPVLLQTLWHMFRDRGVTAEVGRSVVYCQSDTAAHWLYVVLFHNTSFKHSSVEKLKFEQKFDNAIIANAFGNTSDTFWVLKLYAWEIPMEEHINEIRRKELVLLKKSYIVRNVMDSFNTASPFLVALFSFGTYVLSSPSHVLTPQIAFVSLTLFNQLRSPMAMIALLINQLVQAVVSNKRLKEYFVANELDPTVVQREEQRSDFLEDEDAIQFVDFSAKWTDDGPNTLHGINLSAARGSLIAVVGKVGAGKSSLLSALLGEIEKLRGKIGVRGKVAYVPQLPWIQNMTVRDNILFGRPFNRRRYYEVLAACALKPDLKILPHGDKTEIGEKGVNLSGGQKARLSLARAIYQDSDVYLLDDPLSAVDAHVGKHIFEKVLGPDGLLRDKTRILITHRLSYLKSADEIVVLQDGTIIESGPYTVLMNQRGVFYRFVTEYKSSSESEEQVGVSQSDGFNGGLEYSADDYSTTRVSMVRSDSEDKIHPEPLKVDLTKSFSSRSRLSSSIIKSADNVLIQKEEVETGKVKLSVYRLYMKAASYKKSLLFFLFLCGFQLFQMLRSFWLSAWSDDNDGYNQKKMAVGWRLAIYGTLGTVEALSFLLSLVCLSFAGLAASYNLHAPLLDNLLRSPMSFFDTTPLGRILNRCTKDIETVDMLLPTNFRYLGVCVLQVLCTLIVIVISTPIFAVVILPLVVIYYFFLKFYVPTSRQLKRLESTHRSPIFSHFGESIQGAASIRAYDKVEEFQNGSGRMVDAFIRCKYSNIISNRWLAIRLEFIGNLVIFFAALFAVISKELAWVTSPGIVGVSISYALNITEVLNFAVRQISEIEANIVAVERIREYTNTPTEAPWNIPEKKPPVNWPSHGAVNFLEYSTRYREGLGLVLKSISADINEGEKIGIVGRTGAGKSSFTLALFRMIEPASGKILIDGVDISNIGLHDLRSNLTIIPQDPILFSGSLRFNLDPFEKNTDDEIWKALELSHLKHFVAGLQGGLDCSISEGGENISVGQRQLVCLARALLRNTRILVLDEATAAVDVTTDALIQETIREYFRDCTVFTIAHRLNTVMDYDRIMVLKDGRIIEFDSPKTLLCDRNSTFARMVEDSQSESRKA